jgi:hypothetical protein
MLAKRNVIHARFYYGLRSYLHQNRFLLRRAQSLRAYLVLGPLRKPIVWYFQNYRHNKPLVTGTSHLFSNLDVGIVADTIEKLGYSNIGNLPEEFVSDILEYCAADRRVSYWNPHIECESIRSISQAYEIVEIARRYLGAEPILWLTRLKWSFPASDEVSDMQPSLHKEPMEYDPHGFHYDANDFKSLTFFVYLTDIDDLDSGAHVVIEGTHKNKTLKELSRKTLDDHSAQITYGEKVKAISGKKGTVFAEESSAYHKVAACKKRRLILMIYYVLARKIPPQRPATYLGPLGDRAYQLRQ